MVKALRQAVVLGYDAVSPLGGEIEAQWARAIRGESGVGPLTRFPLREGFPVRIAGEVPEIDPAPYPFLSPRALAQWRSPLFKHGLLVAHRALQKSGVKISPSLAPRAAVTFGTAIGGLDALVAADRLLEAEGKMPLPFTNPNSCINMVGGKVSMLLGATGPIVAPIAACATGSASLITGALFLAQGMADVVLCGAVDFPLVEPIVAGFATMNGAYRPRKGRPDLPPGEASRPFSLQRRGFVISEGAAAIVLAAREFADAHGLPYRIVLAGWSLTADASHFVAPHPATVRRCMAEAIAAAGIAPSDIGAVNAHATSTQVGDAVEAGALRDVFPQGPPPVSANKSLIGHAMGASSAIEAVFAMEGMLRETALPTINHVPDPAIPLDCVAEGARRLGQEFVLKNAFGFGGYNACLVFQRRS